MTLPRTRHWWNQDTTRTSEQPDHDATKIKTQMKQKKLAKTRMYQKVPPSSSSSSSSSRPFYLKKVSCQKRNWPEEKGLQNDKVYCQCLHNRLNQKEKNRSKKNHHWSNRFCTQTTMLAQNLLMILESMWLFLNGLIVVGEHDHDMNGKSWLFFSKCKKKQINSIVKYPSLCAK